MSDVRRAIWKVIGYVILFLSFTINIYVYLVNNSSNAALKLFHTPMYIYNCKCELPWKTGKWSALTCSADSVIKEWQYCMLKCALGSRARKLNWACWGSQVAYEMRLNACAICTHWKKWKTKPIIVYTFKSVYIFLHVCATVFFLFFFLGQIKYTRSCKSKREQFFSKHFLISKQIIAFYS